MRLPPSLVADTDTAIACLQSLGRLRAPIDRFFENTVNDDDANS